MKEPDTSTTPGALDADFSFGKKKKRQDEPEEPRFKSQEEFEAFWEELAKQVGQPVEADPTAGKPLEFDEAFGKLMDVMNNKPTNREVLRRTLELCRTRRTVAEVEELMPTWPEFPLVMQPPYRMIKFLIQGGGLVQIELDAQGQPITEARKAGLTPNQVDDLIAELVVETTEVGRAVADSMAPMLRLRELFATFPDRHGLYCELLEFCKEPRTYPDIEGLLTKDKIEPIKTYNVEPGCLMKPSVFVDNLEQACGLVWFDHHWHTTEEGTLVLESLQAL